MLHYLVPDDNQSILALSATVGAITSSALTTLVLYRLAPDIRVSIMLCLQVTGMTIAWQAPFWGNMVGVSVLMFGNFGLMTTLLPLTVYKAKITSRVFQFGSSLAPVLGATIINSGRATGLDIGGFFTVALCLLPVSVVAYFLVLDRSTWRPGAEPHLPTVATADQHADAVGDGPAPAEPTASIDSVGFQEAQQLSLKQRFAAIWEAGFYIGLTVANFTLYAIYNTSIQTYFVASSASFHGMGGVELLDRILLASFSFVVLIGTSTLIPAVAKMPRALLWAPILVQAGFVMMAWLQIGGVIKPVPLWLTFMTGMCIWGVFFGVQFQAPLVLREDRRIQDINREVQIQSLFVAQYATRLVQNIVAVTWLATFNYNLCRAQVEATTPGVSCLLG